MTGGPITAVTGSFGVNKIIRIVQVKLVWDATKGQLVPAKEGGEREVKKQYTPGK